MLTDHNSLIYFAVWVQFLCRQDKWMRTIELVRLSIQYNPFNMKMASNALLRLMAQSDQGFNALDPEWLKVYAVEIKKWIFTRDIF